MNTVTVYEPPTNIVTVYDGGASVEVVNTVTIDSRLTNLGPNQLLDLGRIGLGLDGVDAVTLPYPEALAEVMTLTANSGWIYDPSRLQLVLFGGGHAATNYDAILCLHLDRLGWTQEYKPTNDQPDMTWANWTDTSDSATHSGAWIADLSGVGGPYPRPTARHTYDELAIVGSKLYSFARCNGNFKHTQQSIINGTYTSYEFNSLSRIWAYDFNLKTWSVDPNSETDATSEYGAVCLDPQSGRVLNISQMRFRFYDPVAQSYGGGFIFSNAAGQAQLLDESGNSLPSSVITANLLGSQGQGTTRYCTVDQSFYFFTMQNAVWRVNLNRANPSSTTLTLLSCTGTLPPTPTTREHGVCYDPGNDLFLTGPFGGKFYAFDRKSKVWSNQTMPSNPGDLAAISHCIDFVPEASCAIFATDANGTPKNHTWAYRYQ